MGRNTIIHRRMRVLTQTRSKRPVFHNLLKSWSLAPSSNSGGSPTIQTRMNHSTQVATRRRNHPGLLAFQMVVSGRRNWLGEFVSFVSRIEHRDVVPIGVGRQSGESSSLKGFRAGLAEGIVGAV